MHELLCSQTSSALQFALWSPQHLRCTHSWCLVNNRRIVLSQRLSLCLLRCHFMDLSNKRKVWVILEHTSHVMLEMDYLHADDIIKHTFWRQAFTLHFVEICFYPMYRNTSFYYILNLIASVKALRGWERLYFHKEYHKERTSCLSTWNLAVFSLELCTQNDSLSCASTALVRRNSQEVIPRQLKFRADHTTRTEEGADRSDFHSIPFHSPSFGQPQWQTSAHVPHVTWKVWWFCCGKLNDLVGESTLLDPTDVKWSKYAERSTSPLTIDCVTRLITLTGETDLTSAINNRRQQMNH